MSHIFDILCIMTDRGSTHRALLPAWLQRLLAGRVPLLLLALLLLLMTLHNAFWISQDQLALRGDHGELLKSAHQNYRDLMELDLFLWLFNTSTSYPPLANIVATLLGAVFGFSVLGARLSGSVFLGILIFSTYALGRRAFDWRVGLASAFFAGTTPLVVYFSHEYFLDIPLAAMVTLSLYLLHRTERFTNARYSLLLGVAMGLAMLAKWTFVLYVLGAGLWLLLETVTRWRWRALVLVAAAALMVSLRSLVIALKPWLDGPLLRTLTLDWAPLLAAVVAGLALALVIATYLLRKRLPAWLANMLRAAGLLLLLGGPYYVVNIRLVLAHLAGSAMSRRNMPLVPESLDGLAEHLLFFSRFFHVDLLAIPYTLCLVLGIVLYLHSRNFTSCRSSLLATIAVALAALYFLPDQKARYLLPLIAPASIFATFWLVRHSRPAHVLVPLLVLLGTFQTAGWMLLSRPPTAARGWDFASNRWGIAPAPVRATCNVKSMVGRMVRRSKRKPFFLLFLARGRFHNDYVTGYDLHLGLAGYLTKYEHRTRRIPGVPEHKPDVVREYLGYRLRLDWPDEIEGHYMVRVAWKKDLSVTLSAEEQSLISDFQYPAKATELARCQLPNDTVHVLYRMEW